MIYLCIYEYLSISSLDDEDIHFNAFFHEKYKKLLFIFQTGARATRAFLRDFAKKHPECRRRRSAMLSRKFFADNVHLNHENEKIGISSVAVDNEKTRGMESTSTAVSFLSSRGTTSRDFALESPQTPRHKLNLEQDLDFSIPGAYR